MPVSILRVYFCISYFTTLKDLYFPLRQTTLNIVLQFLYQKAKEIGWWAAWVPDTSHLAKGAQLSWHGWKHQNQEKLP